MPALHPLLSDLIRARAPEAGIHHLVSKIIEQGLIEDRLPVPQQGCSVLTWLIEKRHTEQAARVLDAGADPLVASEAGYQAIHAAAAFNDLDMCQALVKRGASLHAATRDGSTAVHYALADEVDPLFAGWVLDQLRAPAHALMKKAQLGFAASDTAWSLFARYARPQSQVLEVLKLLDERGLIDELVHSTKPSSAKAAERFKFELLHRFGSGVIGGWWAVRSDARALDTATTEIDRPARKMRF